MQWRWNKGSETSSGPSAPFSGGPRPAPGRPSPRRRTWGSLSRSGSRSSAECGCPWTSSESPVDQTKRVLRLLCFLEHASLNWNKDHSGDYQTQSKYLGLSALFITIVVFSWPNWSNFVRIIAGCTLPFYGKEKRKRGQGCGYCFQTKVQFNRFSNVQSCVPPVKLKVIYFLAHTLF